MASIFVFDRSSSYDFPLIEAVVNSAKISVIVPSGAGIYQYLVEGVTQAGASEVAVASIFCFTEQTPAGPKTTAREAGISVRANFISSVKN